MGRQYTVVLICIFRAPVSAVLYRLRVLSTHSLYCYVSFCCFVSQIYLIWIEYNVVLEPSTTLVKKRPFLPAVLHFCCCTWQSCNGEYVCTAFVFMRLDLDRNKCKLCVWQVLLCKSSLPDYLQPATRSSSKQRSKSQIVAVKTLDTRASKQTRYGIGLFQSSLHVFEIGLLAY